MRTFHAVPMAALCTVMAAGCSSLSMESRQFP